VLDDPTVHVHDVERAVGPAGQVHRPEALVGGGEELALGLGVVGGERAARHARAGDDHAPAHQVGGGLGHEGVAAELDREMIAAVDDRRARGGEALERAVGPQVAVLVSAVDPVVGPRRPQGLVLVDDEVEALASAHVRRRRERRPEVGAQVVAVGVVEEPPEVVLGDAPLPAGDGGLADQLSSHHAVAQAQVGAVEPVVEGGQQAVGVVLGVLAGAIALRQHLALVAAIVVVGRPCRRSARAAPPPAPRRP
jgi:hypothetical protein